GGGAGPAGPRGGATAGPVGDLRKRFPSPWLLSVDNRSSLQADPLWDRAGPEALYEFMAEDMAAMATCLSGRRHRDRFNERRQCAWSQPAWRRACPWPVRELNPSRRRATIR